MQIGDIVYLYVADLKSTIAVQQKLIDYRFCRIIDETSVKGGTIDERYIKYKVQSIFDETKILEVNNYLSPHKFCTISELESIIEELDDIILPEQLENISYLIKKIKSINKKDVE